MVARNPPLSVTQAGDEVSEQDTQKELRRLQSLIENDNERLRRHVAALQKERDALIKERDDLKERLRELGFEPTSPSSST